MSENIINVLMVLVIFGFNNWIQMLLQARWVCLCTLASCSIFPRLQLCSFEELVTMATACVQCLCKGHPSSLHPPLHPKTFAPVGPDWTKAQDANHADRTANNY